MFQLLLISVDSGWLINMPIAKHNPRHSGKTYDVTGPDLLRFNDVARTLTDVTGRRVSYVPVTTQN